MYSTYAQFYAQREKWSCKKQTPNYCTILPLVPHPTSGAIALVSQMWSHDTPTTNQHLCGSGERTGHKGSTIALLSFIWRYQLVR